MIKGICLSIVISLLVFSCAQVKQMQHKQSPNAIPVLRITNDTTATPVKISSLSVDIKVAANTATTTFDITFYNPNDRILEGELEFPLADGQHIIRYALDMNGNLREGVVVEKAKARVAFENTIRRKVDPGLVEKTKGNNFRTRIYPLPANGTRHIVIAFEQTLELLNKEFFYQLPLYASEPIEQFSIKTSVIKNSEKPVLEETTFTNFEFKKWENVWLAEYDQNNFIPNQTIAFTIPNSSKDETLILAENDKEQTYFYVNNRIASDHEKKLAPKTIGILWDVSASGEKRDTKKEIQLLKEYFFRLGNVKASLIPFNIIIQSKEDFIINAGNTDALSKRLKEFVYDGGTQFGAIDLSAYSFDEILLFSDGLSTFGKKEIVLSSNPVIAINSSASADFSSLKFIAQQTHGKFIDLTNTELNTAIGEINGRLLQVINTEFNPAEIEDFVIQSGPIQNSGLSFAGKLKTISAIVKVNLGFGNEIKTTKIFTINKPDRSDYNNVKRIWAEMKIAELDLQFEKNKEEITKLGKEFSIVTQNTSLIVLDRVEDYVEHEITPPEELQKEYFTLLKEKHDSEKDDKAIALQQALNAMKELKKWWHKNYSPLKKKEDVFTPDSMIITANDLEESRVDYQRITLPDSLVSDSVHLSISAGLGAFSHSDTGRVSLLYSASENRELNSVRVMQDSRIYNLSFEPGNADGIEDKLEEEKVNSVAKPPTIELNKWKPDVPYLKELEKVAPNERRSKYYLLKKQYFTQPSFFIDVAGFFIEKNEKQFGLLVLSNIAEMKLEDAALLRMVANQLLEANEKELAIEIFREILKIREEEPQSYRDLALALSETGNNNEAVELLYKLITGTWDERFGDVKAIAINEMNAMISGHKDINTSAMDNRFVFPMPVDVRIVIGWNTDNSDIDLWVTDPRNEKCFYEHTETEIGGKISKDVTAGYGPEEFCLRKAWKGNYKVEVNLFGDSRQTLGGPIAIKAELFTDFGKPTQKREIINFRVTTNKEVIQLGSLKFGT
jgi:regulator of extracellular matrix RemA (YlzA/DUF370 family)